MDRKEVLSALIKSLLGRPYRWGGSNPLTGFDCSGMIVELLISQGVIAHATDYSSQSLYDRFSRSWPTPDLPSFGDLVFYGRGLTAISHIGFCLGQGLMVEAGGGGSKTLTAEDAAKQGAWIRVRPVTYRRDLLEFLRPPFGL